MLPKHNGQRAKRIVAKVPSTLFKDSSMDAREKGASLTQTISDVYTDIQEDVLPERTNAVGTALFLLSSYKIISASQYSGILEEMGVKRASSPSSSSSSQSQRKPTSARSVSFAKGRPAATSNADDAASGDEYSDASEVSGESDSGAASGSGGDEDDDDPLNIVLFTLTDEQFEPKASHAALGDYFRELHPDDLHNIEEFLVICAEWLSKKPAEVRATEVAQHNPWLLEMFSECLREVPAETRPRLKKRFEHTVAQVHTELEKAIAQGSADESDLTTEADDFVQPGSGGDDGDDGTEESADW